MLVALARFAGVGLRFACETTAAAAAAVVVVDAIVSG